MSTISKIISRIKSISPNSQELDLKYGQKCLLAYMLLHWCSINRDFSTCQDPDGDSPLESGHCMYCNIVDDALHCMEKLPYDLGKNLDHHTHLHTLISFSIFSYTNFEPGVAVVLLFYVHSKHLRSCRHGELRVV